MPRSFRYRDADDKEAAPSAAAELTSETRDAPIQAGATAPGPDSAGAASNPVPSGGSVFAPVEVS